VAGQDRRQTTVMETKEAMKQRKWDGILVKEASDLLTNTPGSVIVSPTKVGYIIMATDRRGLERKFAAKQRKRNKPGVVLCGSLEQLAELAEMNAEVEAFYEAHWKSDVLLGCILPWKASGRDYIPADDSAELVMDPRQTSCFVVKFGVPGEQVVQELWSKQKRLVFSSSANPSGQGNRGILAGIGQRIASEVDLIIEADDYVASIQPNETVESRYEQGVMVSMVDADGTLVPLQNGERGVSPCPSVIRKGLAVDRVMKLLSDTFHSWDYCHGSYY
jgi:tRNA A37 threonylcarbamoyladenosine synthetase subunit TsaC/SUA5/YrdC